MLVNQGYAAYANNKIATASPAELTLMLYEGAMDNASQRNTRNAGHFRSSYYQ